jgi:hypothetical protein
VIRLFSGLGVGSDVNWKGKLSCSLCIRALTPLLPNANYIGFVDRDETPSPSFFGQPLYKGDFGILLLRVGTASLEATGLRDWNNEVTPISLPVKSINRNRARGIPHTYGVVRTRMGRIDAAKVQHGSSAYTTTSTSRVESSSNSSNPYKDLSILLRRRTKLVKYNNDSNKD